MFTKNNFYSDGTNYNYDALNSILSEMLNGSTDENDIKNFSDRINNELIETDSGKIMFKNICVGTTEK